MFLHTFFTVRTVAIPSVSVRKATINQLGKTIFRMTPIIVPASSEGSYYLDVNKIFVVI